MQLFHGSPKKFNAFDINEIKSANGTNEGYGIYFTTNKKIAEGYAENGFLYTVEIHEQKALSYTEKTLSKIEVIQIIDSLEKEGNEFLSNYGDTDYEGYENVLNRALDYVYENIENDVDILCEFYNVSGENKNILKYFSELGYSHYIVNNPNWGKEKQKIAVVINPSIIEINSIEKIN